MYKGFLKTNADHRLVSIFLMVLVLCVIEPSFSQVKINSSGQFLNGYIVTLENDTIEGVLEILDEVKYCREVRFKKRNVDKAITTYLPKDILAYKIKDDVYESYKDVHCILKSCNNNQLREVFIKLIEEDVLKVFMYAANINSSYLYTIDYIPLVQKKDFKPMPFKTKRHIKKVVSTYFTDYPELSEKLREYTYKYDDFEKVIADYTNWYKANQ